MKFPKIINILFFNESRKVCFGIWLFITSTLLLGKSLITADQWILCSTAASILIGGGTVADTWLSKKGVQNAPPAA